MKKINRILWI